MSIIAVFESMELWSYDWAYVWIGADVVFGAMFTELDHRLLLLKVIGDCDLTSEVIFHVLSFRITCCGLFLGRTVVCTLGYASNAVRSLSANPLIHRPF